MSDIKIEILYFAAAREATQKTQETMTFEFALTLKELKEKLFHTHPQLEKLDPYLRWAVNQNFIDDDEQILNTGDEIALIPPISGG